MQTILFRDKNNEVASCAPQVLFCQHLVALFRMLKPSVPFPFL